MDGMGGFDVSMKSTMFLSSMIKDAIKAEARKAPWRKVIPGH